MQAKSLIIRNSVTLVEGTREVIKVVETPFELFTRLWCKHESESLSRLAELGFAAAPKLITAGDRQFTMQRIDGRSLNGRPVLDDALFGRVLAVVRQLHGLGFAHGNLRPSNILTTDNGEVVLLDFETCCQRGNPLFILAQFSDRVRLHLLWRSTVASARQTPSLMFFPLHVVVAMRVITPLNRCARGLKAIKKRVRQSLKRSAQRRASASAHVRRGRWPLLSRRATPEDGD